MPANEAIIQDGVLYINGLALPHFEREGDVWIYRAHGPGTRFRLVYTVRETDCVVHEQWQHRESEKSDWLDIDNPWGKP